MFPPLALMLDLGTFSPQDNRNTEFSRHPSNWRQSPERPRLFPNPGGRQTNRSRKKGQFRLMTVWRDVFLFRTVESESSTWVSGLRWENHGRISCYSNIQKKSASSASRFPIEIVHVPQKHKKLSGINQFQRNKTLIWTRFEFCLRTQRRVWVQLYRNLSQPLQEAPFPKSRQNQKQNHVWP